jgi:hypothetical protein
MVCFLTIVGFPLMHSREKWHNGRFVPHRKFVRRQVRRCCLVATCISPYSLILCGFFSEMALLDSYPKRAVVMDASVVTKTILDALKADTSRVAGVLLLQASIVS